MCVQPAAAMGRVTWSTGGDCLSHGGSRVAGCGLGLVGAGGSDLVGAGGPDLVGAGGPGLVGMGVGPGLSPPHAELLWPHWSWIYVELEPLMKHQTTSYFGYYAFFSCRSQRC